MNAPDRIYKWEPPSDKMWKKYTEGDINVKDLLDKWRESKLKERNGTYHSVKKYPVLSSVLENIGKLITQDKKNIIKILDSLSEDDIQNYLRAKKLSKLEKNIKK